MPIRRRPIRRRRLVRRKRAGLRKRYARSGRVLTANKQDKAVVVETQELTATPEGGNFITHTLSPTQTPTNTPTHTTTPIVTGKQIGRAHV